MFDPKKIFPVVRRSMTKGTDAQVMTALTKFAQAHPNLNEMQALAALQAYMKQAQPAKKPSVSDYLGGE